MVKNLPAKQETQVRSLDREDSPGEGNGLLSLKFFPGCLILIHIQNNIKSPERRDKLGAWVEHTHATIYKIDNQQRYTV